VKDQEEQAKEDKEEREEAEDDDKEEDVARWLRLIQEAEITGNDYDLSAIFTSSDNR